MSTSPKTTGARKKLDAFLLLRILLLAASAAAILKTIWMGNCGDEATELTLAIDMAGGTKLFAGTFSQSQTADLFVSPFVWLYTALTGTVDYLQIYMRIVGVGMQLFTAWALYRCLKKYISEKAAFLLGILAANFLPKGIQVPEYSTLHVWFETLCFILLLDWILGKTEHPARLLGAGFLFAMAVLAYPTVIAAFPVYLLVIFMLARRMGKKRPVLAAVWFGTGSALALAVFLAYVQVTVGIFGKNGMLANLPYLLGKLPHSTADASHGGGLAGFVARLATFIGLPTLAVLFLLAGAVFLAAALGKKVRLFPTEKAAATAVAALLALGGVGLYLRALLFSWGACNQFTVFTCLLFTFAFGGLCYARLTEKTPVDHALFGLGWVTSWGIFFGMYIGTNVASVNAQTPALLLGILVSCWFFVRYAEQKQVRFGTLLPMAYMAVLCVFVIFTRGVFARAPKSGHYTIFEPWVQMDVGISKGIWMIPNDVEYYKGLYNAAAPYERPGDVVAANWLNFGILACPELTAATPYGYTFDSTPFTFSDDPDAIYKESIAYYKENQRWPDVILVRLWDESFWDTDYYAAIRERYTVVRDEEDGMAILLLDGTRAQAAENDAALDAEEAAQ